MTGFLATPLPHTLLILGGCILIAVVWWRSQDLDPNDLWPELAGMALDVFVILVVFETFQRHRHHKAEIARHRETIDDYKRWDSEEARHRIAGAIRRLNRLEVVKLDLAGLSLSDFEFAKAGIPSIAGSIFYDGTWGEPLRQSEVSLKRVSFGWVDCRDVVFSPHDPIEPFSPEASRAASFLDCDFYECDLRNATFNGASLIWSETPPERRWDYEENDDGSISRIPLSLGPFANVDLAGVSFQGCAFRNADFRDAENIREANFFRATGLETAMFDGAEDRDFVLAAAARKP